MEEKNYLHIVNGDGLAEKVKALDLSGDIIIWREMLCEGPTSIDVGDEEFLNLRQKFLQSNYGISKKDYSDKFIKELNKLAVVNNYEEIVLWFEFDLFSHMNMLAAISFLLQNRKTDPLSLICSKKLDGEDEMSPLAELSKKQLKNHFQCRIHLTNDDISTAQLIWELYCSTKPKRLASEIERTSSFEYLSSSIRAHVERFPSTNTGLNTLETNVLKLIKKHEIKSLHHLLGYALKYQGYYGYFDIQMERVIKKLKPFYEVKDSEVSLNENGLKAVEGKKNFYQILKDDESYGGVMKYDFLYDPENHDLLKL